MKPERDKSFTVGRAGVEIAKAHFLEMGFPVTEATREQDIHEHWDFSTVFGDEEEMRIEVKTEKKAELTGNIFLETMAGGKPGFLGKYKLTDNIIFAYVFPHTQELWFIPVKRLLAIDLKPLKFRTFTHASNNYSCGGYLYPKTELEKITTVRYRYSLVDEKAVHFVCTS